MKGRVLSLVYTMFFVVVLSGESFAINDMYCVKPPFIQTFVPTNVMLVLDYSGSMSFFAYPGNTSSYDENKTYFGFFKPEKMYRCSSWSRWRGELTCVGYWYIDDNSTFNNSNNGTVKYDASSTSYPYSSYYYFTVEREYSGNVLNWLIMTRIDILRWILTGGKMDSSGNFLVSYWGEYIYKQDASSYDLTTGNVEGILQKIADQNQKPRIGALIFQTQWYRPWFIQFTRIGLSYNYANLISLINNHSPYGGTPTGPAMQDIMKYFEEDKTTILKYGDVDPYNFNGNIAYCAKNFAILMSDGEWNVPTTTTSSDPIRPIDAMWRGGNADLVPGLEGNQNVRTYSVAMFQNPNDSGTNALKWMAVYGNYIDLNDNGYPCNVNSYPNTSLTVPENLENQSQCSEVRKNQNGNGPYGFFSGNNPAELKAAILDVFNEILKQASSGTSTSVLSKKEKVNAGVLQAAFYPQKVFESGGKSFNVDWIGTLYNWWFYFSETGSLFKANIREDTITNKDLDICNPNGTPGGDYIISYKFENNKLKIEAFKSLCNGDNESSIPEEVYNGLDEAHYIWEAGKKLSLEPPLSRKIYTFIGNTRPSLPQNPVQLYNISKVCGDNCSKLFGDDNGNGTIDDDNETYKYAKEISLTNLIDYIYGQDISGYRNRTIDVDNDTWKLGDIVYSTPKVVNYDNFSVAFVGANDGMLHAFLVGKYRYDNLGVHQLVKLRDNITSNGTSDLGKELWAFVPKNVLPYLRFLADPDYCHMYYVDLTPTIYEIKDSLTGKIEKILIGGMRLGGAVGCDNASVCINPPKDTCDNTSSSNCLGLSSYFALDITNPLHPKFLWEFTDPDLGFSYSGPTLIKEYNSDNNTMRYYIMFASGPTDYNGESGQDLYVFILELNKDFTIKSVIKKDLSDSFRELKNAFAGRMSSEGIVDKDFSSGKMVTKAVFFGVVYNDNGNWKGNVIGVKGLSSVDPSNWQFFELFKDPTGPIVVPISYYKCGGKWFLYFGTGRYFYRDDDPNNTTGGINRLYGIKIDKCIKYSGTSFCTLGSSDLYTSDDSCFHINDDLYGWYQDLDPAEDNYNKERDITGATLSSTGAVFFTTTEPTSDICGFGGRSRMWGLNCASGQSLVHQTCSVTGNIVGVLLLQTSVGKITAFRMNIVNKEGPEGNVNPFVKKGEKATNWTVGTAPPNKSALVERPTRTPAQILYEIEK